MNDLDKLRAFFQEQQRRIDMDVCPKCNQEGMGLAHSLYCPDGPPEPPIGGWPEPHKDDL